MIFYCLNFILYTIFLTHYVSFNFILLTMFHLTVQGCSTVLKSVTRRIPQENNVYEDRRMVKRGSDPRHVWVLRIAQSRMTFMILLSLI